MDDRTQELLAKQFSVRFEEYNDRVLRELAKIIREFKGLPPSEARKLAQQLEYDKSYVELLDDLSRLTKMSKKELKKVLEEVAKQNIEFSEVYFKARKMKTPVYENSRELQTIVNTVADMSGGDFKNIAQSTGFRLMGDRIINGKIFKVPLDLDIKTVYNNLIDECVYSVIEGKVGYDEAMSKVIEELSESGVRYIEYQNEDKKVTSQSIESAVRRNVMDSIRETAIKTSEALGEQFDYDGWEVTVHTAPAPDHMYVQGHQFKKEEFDKFQHDEDCVDVNGVEYPAESEETGRDRRSIGQYNCYHTAFTIIVGVDDPLFSKKQLDAILQANEDKIEYEGKKYTLYELTQLQRNIESRIRKQKNRYIMYSNANKDGEYTKKILKAQKKITQLSDKYREVTALGNVRDRLVERTQVPGY
jgi:rRNA pseudouridine-1189 N-methylase Emg1 (Nep1/Mra1 family)